MLTENILKEIQRDIASFSDPGSVVEIKLPHISWQRSRQVMSASLHHRQNQLFPDIEYCGKRY